METDRKKKLLKRSQLNNIKKRILEKDKSNNSDSSTDEEYEKTDEETDEEECHVCGGTGSSSCHLDEKCRNCNN